MSTERQRPTSATVALAALGGCYPDPEKIRAQTEFDASVTTGGGPVNATRVIQYYIYQRAFTESDFGYGSAIAVILFLILALVAFIQMKFLKGNESDLD